jgi:hypothetical protein
MPEPIKPSFVLELELDSEIASICDFEIKILQIFEKPPDELPVPIPEPPVPSEPHRIFDIIFEFKILTLSRIELPDETPPVPIPEPIEPLE